MPAAIGALLWNLLGCFAYLSDVRLSAEDIAAMPEAQQAMYAARTWWGVAGTAVAAWFGAVGSLGLVLRKRWAVPLLFVSLGGVIVQDVGILSSGATAGAGTAGLALQGLVLVICVALAMLSRNAAARGWLA